MLCASWTARAAVQVGGEGVPAVQAIADATWSGGRAGHGMRRRWRRRHTGFWVCATGQALFVTMPPAPPGPCWPAVSDVLLALDWLIANAQRPAVVTMSLGGAMVERWMLANGGLEWAADCMPQETAPPNACPPQRPPPPPLPHLLTNRRRGAAAAGRGGSGCDGGGHPRCGGGRWVEPGCTATGSIAGVPVHVPVLGTAGQASSDRRAPSTGMFVPPWGRRQRGHGCVRHQPRPGGLCRDCGRNGRAGPAAVAGQRWAGRRGCDCM